MDNRDLFPQTFDPDALTLLPEINFFVEASNKLPQVYQNAPNFMAQLKVICDRKQFIYDIIRSLVNVFNLNSSDGFTPATPTRIYLEILASNITAPFSVGDLDIVILNSIRNRINFVNSRGKIDDFYRYFVLNSFGSNFTNSEVIEEGNATLNITVPLNPTGTPDPLTVFQYDMFKLKAAGIEINVNPTNPPMFAFSTLSGPDKFPNTKGFATLDARRNATGGGFYKTIS